tara:strand:- start:4895 stop:5083 length:189 start_codon:yes stop_codon:yes gene_type:complete
MDMIKVLFSSKKFTAMVIGIVATFLSTRFGLPEEQVREIVALIIAYIIGQGVADMGKRTTTT